MTTLTVPTPTRSCRIRLRLNSRRRFSSAGVAFCITRPIPVRLPPWFPRAACIGGRFFKLRCRPTLPLPAPGQGRPALAMKEMALTYLPHRFSKGAIRDDDSS